MKKKSISVILCLVMLLSCISFLQPAAINAAPGISTPWNDSSILAHVYDDLNDIPDQNITFSNAGVTGKIENGQLKITSNTNGSWQTAHINLGNGIKDITGAIGAGFYFENNLTTSMYIIPIFNGENLTTSTKQGDPVALVNAAGVQTDTTFGAYGTISLPVGFKGYIVVPFTSLYNDKAGGANLTAGNHTTAGDGFANFTTLSIKFSSSSNTFDIGDEYLLYDNFFIYGKDVTAKGMDLLNLTRPSDGFNPVLRFAVLSDTHFNAPNDVTDKLFPSVMSTLYNISNAHPPTRS